MSLKEDLWKRAADLVEELAGERPVYGMTDVTWLPMVIKALEVGAKYRDADESVQIARGLGLEP